MSGLFRNAEEAVLGFADSRQIQSREFSRGWRTILLLFMRGQERRRAAAVQDAGAFSGDDRISRSAVGHTPLSPAMTTANKITILRILLIPFFVVELIYYLQTG